MDHQIEGIDVDAAGGDVGGHEHRHLAGREIGQRLAAGGLAAIAVERLHSDALPGQVVGHAGDPVFRVAEEHHPPLPCGDPRGDGVGGVVVGDAEDEVLHRVHRHHGGRDLVACGGASFHQRLGGRVQGRGKQHARRFRRSGTHESGDVGQEPQRRQLVGLVDDGDRDVVKRKLPLPPQIVRAARGDHRDVDGRGKGELLPVDVLAADERADPQARGGAEIAEDVGDLIGELASGRDDQAARAAGLRRRARQGLDHRDAEGQRLAGPRRRAAEDVAAGQRIRQHGGLDGRRLGHAHRPQRADHRLRDPQIVERRGRGGGRSRIG